MLAAPTAFAQGRSQWKLGTLLWEDAESSRTLQGINVNVAMVAHSRAGTVELNNTELMWFRLMSQWQGSAAPRASGGLFEMQSAFSREVKY